MELKRAFPDLFILATDKNCVVSSVGQMEDGRTVWNPMFRRHLQDWEVNSCLLFFDRIYSQQIGRCREDMVRWEGDRGNKFSVKSYYSLLSGKEDSGFPWKSVWKTRAPSRAAFFAWEACHEAILTGDNLRIRRMIYVDWCFMCKSSGESTNHLLLHCPVARVLWNWIFGLFNLSWVMPGTVKAMFLSWSLFKRRRKNLFWEAAPLGGLLDSVEGKK